LKKEHDKMRAARILQIGSPNVIVSENLSKPEPGNGQVLVRVQAAGVGPWDALIREGKSGMNQLLPLTLGSDLAGIVEAIGPGVSGFKAGDEVYGMTNERFVGAYAEYALASATMLAPKPKRLSFIEAASVPVVAVTAWQMLFEYAHAVAGQTVLILGGAGNVGAYAVQLAKHAGINMVATAGPRDIEYVRNLGAETVLNYRATTLESLPSVDAVIDTVGGEAREDAFSVLKPDGILVTVVSPAPEAPRRDGRKAVFFFVDVTTARLNKITELLNSGDLITQVGTVLPLEEARVAHEMLGGAPHSRGKIVLQVAA
jgi:NADPH:quinone reductase-like Zn-dependent oxidoreductase